MKILIISGGTAQSNSRINTYLEELIEGVSSKGCHVACLLTALWSVIPGMHWRKEKGSPITYKIFNAGIYPGLYPEGGIGTKTPLKDVKTSRRVRKVFLEILEDANPDIVHFQNFMGFPVELVEEVQRQGIRTVFTAHDYLVACPTAHLFLPDGTNCALTDRELICEKCCSRTPRYLTFWARELLQTGIKRLTVGSGLWKLTCFVRNFLEKGFRAIDAFCPKPVEYSMRREVFRSCLRKMDVIICISEVQRSVMEERMGILGNLKVMRLSRKSIRSGGFGRRIKKPDDAPVVFAALNVSKRMKGKELMREVFSKIEKSYDNWELRIYGNGQDTRLIKHLGHYSHQDLDLILQDVDFGIVPSVWWETYAFTGAEMLVRGIPLLASRRAGVSELVQEEVNGLTFDPDGQEGLCNVVERVINDSDLRFKLMKGGEMLKGEVPGWDKHLEETVSLYEALIKEKQG